MTWFYRCLLLSHDSNLLYDDLVCMGNQFFEGSEDRGWPATAKLQQVLAATRDQPGQSPVDKVTASNAQHYCMHGGGDGCRMKAEGEG
ncbi:hypothetical protein B296_00035281 [Ensete ventricosum]|uniref:Uncharacterized protein n=1 Tax=Ensete ventricosum TaxID=4639 RepID=A0A426XTF2_ENSVE|nr:hypothetical protein B296_00035281 [Ensete ventricosum]